MPHEVDHFDTEILPADAAGIARAAKLIAAGLPVAVPTETVYGLAADAANADAVARVYHAKGRPAFNPLIVHVPDADAARRLARFNALADALAERFWPGPLTLVLPLLPGARVASLVTAGLPTVALRVPAHPAACALLAQVAADGIHGLAAPSANRSGQLSPTRAAHVLASLGGRIAAVLDGGACAAGLESSIVAPVADTPRLLRHGAIPLETLRDVIPDLLPADADEPVSAPGMTASHYAPRKPLRLNAGAARPGEWLIGFGTVAGDATLSAAGDLREAAARLFDLLHRADAGPAAAIAVAPIPDDGLGVAINDRLRRAAAP